MNTEVNFWALMRALEQENAQKGAAPGGRPRYGHSKRPSEENVRIGQEPYLNFPPTDISDVEKNPRSGVDALIEEYFFGLLGPSGPMPLEFTSFVRQRAFLERDKTWQRFLDIIHHRFSMLFYRAFAQNEQAISHDRSDDDPVADIARSLSGFGRTFGLGQPQANLALAFAGTLGSAAKTRDGLQSMLHSLFDIPIEVEDFVDASYDIPEVYRCILGNRKTAVLGQSAQIGRSYHSITRSFRIRIGVITYAQYQYFVEGQVGMQLLDDAVRMYLDRPLEYSVLFRVNTYSMPLARLGFDWQHEEEDAAGLGWTAWLGSLDENVTEVEVSNKRIKRPYRVF